MDGSRAEIDPERDLPTSRAPRVDLATVSMVFGGGVAGGLVRYGITSLWPANGHAFPWSTFVVNTTGAFALPLLVVVLSRLQPPGSRLRPLLGTGFLGAYTTFSSVMTTADQQFAHDRRGTAVAYVLLSLAAAGLAVVAGLATGRRLPLRARAG